MRLRCLAASLLWSTKPVDQGQKSWRCRVDRQLFGEFGQLDQVLCREPDSAATPDQPMCAEPDENGLSLTLPAQRLIANRQKLRFDAQCLIVPRMIRTGDLRPLRGVHRACRNRGNGWQDQW